MTSIVLSTHNAGKTAEIRELLRPLGWDVRSLADLGLTEAPEETGTTFLENARIKAKAALGATGLPALADDSGLCVPALGGAPGVLSARFGGFDTDEARNAHLLRLLENADDRAAYFSCVMMLCFPDGREIWAQGRLDGVLLRTPRGQNGFGYDPLFLPRGQERTLAEMGRAEKSSLSHRGVALRALTERLAAEQL